MPELSMTCWRCREAVEGPACVSCGAVQPPPKEPDHFQILGLLRRFHLEQGEIDRAWREASRVVHPDRHVGSAAVERRMSLQWTAAVNNARRVLRDPLTRARWLATGRDRPPEEGAQPDPDFLEQVFQLRMAASTGDEEAGAQAGALRESVMGELAEVFRRWEEGEGDLTPVEPILARLQYLERMLRQARQP